MSSYKIFIFVYIALIIFKQAPAYSQCSESEIMNLKKKLRLSSVKKIINIMVL